MGFRPDPVFAKSELMKKKQPFYNRVRHRHDIAKQRYASLNFPVKQGETVAMKD